MQNILIFCPILRKKTRRYKKIVLKIKNTEFHENPSGERRDDLCGETEGRIMRNTTRFW